MGEEVKDDAEVNLPIEEVGPDADTRPFKPEEIIALGLAIALHDAKQAGETQE